MPIFPRYLDNIRNKFAGTGLYDDPNQDMGDPMAITPEMAPAPRRMMPPPPPPEIDTQALPPMQQLTDGPPSPNVMAPPMPPPGMPGPRSPEQILIDKQQPRPDVGKPNKWQMLAAGALGGLQGYKNAARPQDRPMNLDIGSIIRPKATQQMVKFDQRQKDLDSQLKATGDVENIATNRDYRKGINEDRTENRADRKKNSERDDADRKMRLSLDLAKMNPKVVAQDAPPTQGAIRMEHPLNPGTFIDVIPPNERMKVEDPEIARFLGLKKGDETSSAAYLKAMELRAEAERERTKADAKTPPNQNEWEIRNRAAQGDQVAVKLLKDMADEKVRVANASRAPKDTKPLKPAPQGIVKSVVGNNDSIRTIDVALNELKSNPGAIGIVKGGGWDKAVNYMDPKGVAARAAIGNVGSLIVHDRSGAAVTASEIPRLRPFIPSTMDDAVTVKKKLAALRSAIEATNNDIREVYSEDQGFIPIPSATPSAPEAKQPTGKPGPGTSGLPAGWSVKVK